MHFITENKLREIYRKTPFQEFTLQSEERLTPEGKQFLLDRKITLLMAQTVANESSVVETSPEFLFHKQWLSCELYEATILAMDHSVTMSQVLLKLGQEINEKLGKELDGKRQEDTETDFETENLEIEAVHLFSRHGKLLIKLKKIDALIQLIHVKYPQCQEVLLKTTKQLNELRKQLVGADQ